jgi:beta-lactamase class A
MRKILLRIMIVILVLSGAGLTTYYYLNRPTFKLKSHAVTIELGAPLALAKADYIEATPDLLPLVNFDLSKVDTLKTGDYPVLATYKDKQDQLTVTVKDTQPPTAQLVSTDITISEGVKLAITELVAKVTDFSAVTMSFSASQEQADQLFTQPGDQVVTLYLTDAAGNQKTYDINIHVKPKDKIPPVFSGLKALTVKLGVKPDLASGINATDNLDGDLTTAITYIDTVNYKKIGSYTVTYRVADRAGNVALASRTIIVEDPYKALRAANKIIVGSDQASNTLLNSVLDYLGTRINKMGIVYYDLKTGKGFSINQDVQFRSASTAKLFVNMTLYNQVDKGLLSLNQKISYQASDYEGGTGVLQGMDRSVPYSLGTLADYAMKYSDNIAFNMLRRFLGRENCFDYYELVIGHATNHKMTSMGAADGYDLMKKLYTSKSANSKHMLATLRQTIFTSMLPKYLPKGIVAHKVGFYGMYYHDVGVVYAGDRPYIIAIYSGGLASPEETIAQVSRRIYENR